MHPLFWDQELSRMHLHPEIQIPNAFPAYESQFNGSLLVRAFRSVISVYKDKRPEQNIAENEPLWPFQHTETQSEVLDSDFFKIEKNTL